MTNKKALTSHLTQAHLKEVGEEPLTWLMVLPDPCHKITGK
jgi:hypothetical protein